MFGVGDHCVDAQPFAGFHDLSKGRGDQEFPDTPAFHATVAGEATDQHGGNRVVAREPASELVGQFSESDRECAEAVETDDAELVVACDKDLGDVSLLLLASTCLKPVGERGLLA